MSSFVITNTGTIPIKIAGVDLAGGGACRGCPIEHLDKIEAPKGATYFINYSAVTETMKTDIDGNVFPVKQQCADIQFNGVTLKAGERTREISVKLGAVK